MSRVILLIAALLLPLQFAWSGSAIGCSVGTTVQVSVGKVPGSSETPAADGCVDPNCASCHAPTPPIAATHDPVEPVVLTFASGVAARPVVDTSAWARAPDRPQWTRLV